MALLEKGGWFFGGSFKGIQPFRTKDYPKAKREVAKMATQEMSATTSSHVFHYEEAPGGR